MKNAKTRRVSPNKRYQKRRETIGFRPPPPLRELLEKSAAEAGHSISAEISVRLHQAYSDRDWARRSLVAAFGDYETMAIIFTMARAAIAVTNRRRAHWLTDSVAWSEALEAIERLLYRIVPEGRTEPAPSAERRKAWEQYTATEAYRKAGKFTALELLSIIEQGGQNWWPFGDPDLSHTRELQRDIVDRAELLHQLQRLLRERKGSPHPSDDDEEEDPRKKYGL